MTHFRQEALSQFRNRQYGTVFINTPWHYSLLCIGCSVLLLGIFLFIGLAEFSEKCLVTGYLNSNKGMVRIYPKQQGIILQRRIKQGENVHKGTPLFLIDTSYEVLNAHEKPKLQAQLEEKKYVLEQALARKKRQLASLKPLLLKRYISSSMYHGKLDELSVLERQRKQFNMELIRYQQARSYLVRAPVDGVISSVMYQVGQQISPSKPLVSILPNHAHLIAELFVPVVKAGFLNKSDRIVLRYDAYPYQHFGVATGRIVEVSQNILTDAEEDKPLRIGQPYYKVKAHVDSQDILLYGQDRPLQQGMTFSAVLNGPRKKIWQWIMEPLLIG